MLIYIVILEKRRYSIYRMNGKDVALMPNIKPISDLRNYTEVLKEAQGRCTCISYEERAGGVCDS